MHKIKDRLRLHLLGGITSRRRIGRAVGCGKTAVAECLQRAAAAGLTTWDAVVAVDEEALEARLYPTAAAKATKTRSQSRPLPDWVRIREELTRRDHKVTLMLLWTEYKAEHPDGYEYSRFAELYRKFERKLSVVMRQHHRPGEKTFVDFCDGLALTNPMIGEKEPTQLFVGALGASSYTFATATRSQSLPEWLDCHVQMYGFYQGVSALTMLDNLRAGVSGADRYEAAAHHRRLFCLRLQRAQHRRQIRHLVTGDFADLRERPACCPQLHRLLAQLNSRIRGRFASVFSLHSASLRQPCFEFM